MPEGRTTRFTRAQLGLPPEGAARRRAWEVCLVLAAVVAVGGAAGVLAGRLAYREAEAVFVAAAGDGARTNDPAARQAALRTLQQRRAALSGSVTARLALANALLAAAQRLPDASWPYWQDARHELEGARECLAGEGLLLTADELSHPWMSLAAGESPDAGQGGGEARVLAPAVDWRSRRDWWRAWMVERDYAWVMMELGEDARALEAMSRAEAWRRRLEGGRPTAGRRAALNDLAYLLATAKDPGVRDAAGSLRLAKAMMMMPTVPDADGAVVVPASESAAFVDTLAAAYAVNGRRREALAAQRMALALADEDDLTEYLKHYREMSAARGGVD